MAVAPEGARSCLYVIETLFLRVFTLVCVFLLFSQTVSSNLIGVITVPFFLSVLLEVSDIKIEPGPLLVKLLLMILLPLAVGKVARDLSKRLQVPIYLSISIDVYMYVCISVCIFMFMCPAFCQAPAGDFAAACGGEGRT